MYQRAVRAGRGRLRAYTPAVGSRWIAGSIVVAVAWAIMVAAFVAFTVEVDGRYHLAFDLEPTRRVQDAAAQYALLDAAFDVVNALGELEVIVLVLGICIAYCALRRLWLEAALFAGAAAFGVVQYALRRAVHRPFPGFDNSPDPVEVFPVGDSYPSGHVFGEVIVYGLIAALAPRLVPWAPAAWVLRALCLCVIAFGMPARLATGSHWPSDVIGSVMLALIYLVPGLWLYATAVRRART